MNAGTTLSGIGSTQSSIQSTRQINFFVDGALGDDSNLGTVDSPFKTIQYAIDASDESVNPGENRIYVNPGNYYEELFIYDQDPLMIDGLGNSPWDVMINSTGSGSSMSTIRVFGSSEVYISDVWVTGPKTGISANQVHDLTLDHVVSAYNSFEGLRLYNATDVNLFGTMFLNNGYEGFRGGFIENLNAEWAYFSDNQYSGVDLYGISHAKFENSRAMRNGLAEQATMGANGIDVHDVESLHVIASSFSDNFGDGFKGLNVTQAMFNGVNAGQNGWNGVNILRTTNLENFGGNFVSNGLNGFNLADPFFETYGENPDPTYATIYGGQFSSNGAYGLMSNLIDYVRVEGVDARSNDLSGINVFNANSFNSYGGFFYGNYASGIQASQISQVHIEGVVSSSNQFAGLTVYDVSNVNVIGSAFLNNSISGVYIAGRVYDYVDEVNITNVSTLHNFYGLKASFIDRVNVHNGNYSENDAHGIELVNFASSNFMYVKATDNDASGVRLNIGRFTDNKSGGENVNNSVFVGGDYNHNAMDGITVSSYFDRSYFNNYFEFHGSYLSADYNGRNGLNFIDDRMIDNGGEEGEGEGEGESSFEGGEKQNFASVYLKHSGFVGNTVDGVFLYGDNQQPYPVALVATFDSIFANDNGRYGLRADSHLTLNALNQDFAPDSESWFTAYNCEFLRNGSDGAMLNFSGVLPTSETPHFATLSEIDAHDNGGNGMTIYALIDWENEPTITLDSKVLIENSRFINNALNGLHVRAGSTPDDTRADALETHEVDFEINNVTALVNGASGLNFGGFHSKEFGHFEDPNVAVNGGHYNDNVVDGIYMQYVNYALINESNIISNEDDGLQLDDVTDADYSSAFITANGDNDIEVN